ncbi:Uncharacterised protein [Brucella suis]|nr:Uncharacterised protein [Brucella suis]
MFENTPQIIMDTRQMLQISGLAVALIKPHKKAEQLGIALRAHGGIGFAESRFVKGMAKQAALIAIGGDDCLFQFRRNGHARIKRQRGHIIGRRADHRVLKINDANLVLALCAG